jgi:hypothetical protein
MQVNAGLNNQMSRTWKRCSNSLYKVCLYHNPAHGIYRKAVRRDHNNDEFSH